MAYSRLRLLFFSLLFALQCKGYALQPQVRPSDFTDYCVPDKINNIFFEQNLEYKFENDNEINIEKIACSIKLTSLQTVYIGLYVVLNDDEFDENGNKICDEGNYIEVLDTKYNSLHVWCTNEGRYLYSNNSEVFIKLRLRRFTKVTSFMLTADEYTAKIFDTGE
ncbi:uncharacterized protein LOC117106385 [Anneissia japonica]|uniref:uncharacterized protein LOC117106385 n=1 Tax=Anneissia japonica TaxID=1529436 RepID=UPI001425ACB8|nr:uncharacterized protein LOC117106385 [Anneissia japonica]